MRLLIMLLGSYIKHDIENTIVKNFCNYPNIDNENRNILW